MKIIAPSLQASITTEHDLPIAFRYSANNLECDCACAMSFRPYREVSFSTPSVYDGSKKWICNKNIIESQLDERHHALFNLVGYGGVIVVNELAYQIYKAFNQPLSINELETRFIANSFEIEKTIKQLLQFGALCQLGSAPPHLEFEQDQILTVWLHVTNRCNLRCIYCYLSKTDEAMNEEVGHQAIAAVFRSALIHGYHSIKLKYAGGEPTLNFSLVLKLHRQAQSLAEKHGIQLEEVILSNGVSWSSQMIEEARSHKIKVMISLDGIGYSHDSQRLFRNGKGSFPAVSKTIERLLDHGVVPDISITVSECNLDGLPELIYWLLEHDLPFSLNFCRDSSHSMSDENMLSNESEIIEGMKAAYAVIEANLPRQSLTGSLLDRVSLLRPHRYTCAVGSNYLVIDQHGHVAKCQMDIAHPVTDINVKDPLALIWSDKSRVQNLDVDEKEECSKCQWRYWCAGGCPLTTYRATGRYDLNSPFCSIYKELFPDMVRLEGLRLVKYASHLTDKR